MTITVDDLKRHLNIETGDTSQDTLLAEKIGVATSFVEVFTGGTLTDASPAPLGEAVRQLAAHLFEHREASLVGVSAEQIPFGVFDLLTPYRAWAF
jgi:hypothetical protein